MADNTADIRCDDCTRIGDRDQLDRDRRPVLAILSSYAPDFQPIAWCASYARLGG
jgi:hypothetical protein